MTGGDHAMPAMVSPVMVSPVAGAPVSALASADTGGGACGVITAPGRAPAPAKVPEAGAPASAVVPVAGAPAPAMVPEAGVAPVAGDGADRGGGALYNLEVVVRQAKMARYGCGTPRRRRIAGRGEAGSTAAHLITAPGRGAGQ